MKEPGYDISGFGSGRTFQAEMIKRNRAEFEKMYKVIDKENDDGLERWKI